MVRRWIGLLACAVLAGAGACGGDETNEWSPTGGGGNGTGGTGGTAGGGTGGGGNDPGILVGELASRTGGVAPLAVFFDAVGTPDVVQPAEVDGHREYADLHYAWDFGDSGTVS